MGYRDDREALRQKVESLSGDLERAQVELEAREREISEHEAKDERDESEIARMRDELNVLRKRLGLSPNDLQGEQARKRLLLIMVGGVLVLAMAGGIAFLLVSADPEMTESAPKPAIADIPAAPDPDPLPEPPSPPEAPLPATPVRTAVFGASILDSRGVDAEPGDGCLLHADLGPSVEVSALRLQCGEEILYDSNDELGAGVEMFSQTGLEDPGPKGGLVYGLLYQDHGMRSGPRSQISAASQNQTLRVWSEGARAFEATLYLDDRSFEYFGEPLAPETAALAVPPGRGLRARARVREREGPVPRAIDDRCELIVRPSSNASSFNCRVMLLCGAEVVYGESTAGYNACTFEEGIPVSAGDAGITSADGDPSMRFDWEDKSMRVSDESAGEPWSITLRLMPVRESALLGRWVGSLVRPGEEPMPMALSFRQNGRATLRLGRAGVDGETRQRFSLDAPSARVKLVDEDGEETFEAAFGPGFHTLFGMGADGTRYELMRP